MATRWLNQALEYEGLMEIKGAEDHPKIVEWLTDCGVPNATDEIPWCAAFVNGVLKEAGVKGTGSATASSFVDWGEPAEEEVGAIAVFRTHVAFVAHVHPELKIIGGNQSDGVQLQPARYYGEPICFRWPTEDIETEVVPKGWSEEPPEDIEMQPGAILQPGQLSIDAMRKIVGAAEKRILEAAKSQYSEVMDRLDYLVEEAEKKKPAIVPGMINKEGNRLK